MGGGERGVGAGYAAGGRKCKLCGRIIGLRNSMGVGQILGRAAAGADSGVSAEGNVAVRCGGAGWAEGRGLSGLGRGRRGLGLEGGVGLRGWGFGGGGGSRGFGGLARGFFGGFRIINSVAR